MNLSEGTRLYGFVVQRVREVPELSGNFIEMVHEKTGAELVWMDNKAVNKLFSVAFKTIPEDSTGVFHILEHSVLCGSEQYPVKEPFVDLMKSSMNTFLNAMTYPDKTVYPVSSCNEKDFLNLTSVYLDAVFAPRLLQEPNIFYQEGIHTEVEKEDAYYKGVVFNEMKGAMADVEARIEARMNELLFPDTCYRFNSGGDPAVIPDLTYEQYKETYQRFYHPSNARFFLDGDIPLEETLQKIDAYLKRYEKKEMFAKIPMQTPAAARGTGYYEITEEEDKRDKAILVSGKIFGTWADREKILAAQILCDVLADSNEAPLKRAVLSSGLAEDFSMSVMQGIQQACFVVTARNMKESNADALHQVIHRTVRKLLEEGLDKNSVMASINRFAFYAKQVSEPQGLERALNSYQSWLYGGDPLMYLVYDEVIQSMREKAVSGEFEELLKELMEEEGTVILQMLPSVTLGEEEQKREEERIEQELSVKSQAEIQELIQKNENLAQWQIMPDSPEASATIPMLSLDEVDKLPQRIETAETREGEVTLLYHPVATHGIVYLSMYFPLTDFTLEELTKLSIFPVLFGELPTERYTVAEIQQKIKTYIGSLNFNISVMARVDQREQCTPCLEVHAGVLEENFAQAKELILEVLTKTQFHYPDKIREIVVQAEEEARQGAVGNGHSLGIAAVQAHYSAQSAVSEAVRGYSMLRYLHDLVQNFEEKIPEFLTLVDRVIRQRVGKAGLVVSVTASDPVSVTDLLSALPEGNAVPAAASYQTKLPYRLGIRIPAQISFAMKGYHLSCCQETMSGSLRVAANILSLSYLWNEVRVQGGAYGAGFAAGHGGGMFCYSYRDPSPNRSLQVYDGMADFLKVFYDSGEETEKFVISTVAGQDSLRSPQEEGMAADNFRFSGITYEDRCELRRQMLETNRDSLLNWQKALRAMAEKGAVCVVGNQEALKECNDLTVYEL